MKVRLSFPDLSAPQVLEGMETLVVYDDFGAPILLVQKMAHGLVLTYTPNDPKFMEAMRAMGIGLNARYNKVIGNGPRKAIESPKGA